MTFTMKIQPIDFDSPQSEATTTKPVLKSRLKRLFDRPFRTTTASEKPFPGGETTEFEPSSVCLTKMVQNFIEENNEKQAKCGRNRCNCFNGNNNDNSSDDESDLFVSDHLKSLITCVTVAESNLLTEATKIVDKINKSVKRKDEMRKIVNEGLLSLNYDSSICKSRWEKSPSFPAGEYEYIDVIVGGGGERVLIDVDFRSEFDIARQTSGYKALLQSLPFIFVGKSDRLSQIVAVVSEAAKQSLKKSGMHLPPWRKAEYMRSKWLSSYTRAFGNAEELPVVAAAAEVEVDCVERELVFEEKSLSPGVIPLPSGDDVAVEREVKVVTGLALLFNRKSS
ncbi:unnamed protein product [Eruca vesicaria subsp. sativa]|uniref:Uncharacterized protein n=1 Tax=Eruca vesicaria subsp. sativa TaxID=29727 RepID=A0ABC8LUC7_ERUVS|nr:unnamed protein product [Eruca vesicaria subsp. sativa]